MEPSTARRMWTVLEPYHAMVYFAPEAREAYTNAGLKGFWMGYFASRSAGFGPVSAPVVTATFFNFAPRMVERAIPDAWHFSTPAKVLAAREQAADLALRRLLADHIDSDHVAEAAGLARTAVESCHPAGRPLFAAHSSLPWPELPHLALWHAATLLREYRGDGHVAATLAVGVDGCETHILLVAGGVVPREALQPHRGWTDDEWAAAETRLVARGWLDETGALTELGAERRAAIECQTDQLAMPAWEHLGEDDCERLYHLMLPLSRQIVDRGGIPIPNPVGVPRP